jgi:hypothetical protein
MIQERRRAVAYLRTSSRTNVGADKDSDKRQLASIEAYPPFRPRGRAPSRNRCAERVTPVPSLASAYP